METVSLARMARRLGVTQQWLRDEADAGRVPCIKAGTRYIFEPQAVQAELARRAATESRWSMPKPLAPVVSSDPTILAVDYAEAGRRLGVSESTIRRLCGSGELRAAALQRFEP